eukprot:439798_1
MSSIIIQNEFEVERSNKLNSNIFVFAYIHEIVDALNYSVLESEFIKCTNLCLSFYCFQVDKLNIGDKIDRRDKMGKWCSAKVIDQNKDTFKIHYEEWDSKYDVWSDSKTEINLFTAFRSISKRKAHKFTELTVGDYVDINPLFYKNYQLFFSDEWKTGRIVNLDAKSGQVEVVYQRVSGAWSLYWSDSFIWVHLDNKTEIRESTKKHNNIDNIYQNQVIYKKGHVVKKKRTY